MDLIVLDNKQLLKTTYDKNGNKVITIKGDYKLLNWSDFICNYLNNKEIESNKNQIKYIKSIINDCKIFNV